MPANLRLLVRSAALVGLLLTGIVGLQAQEDELPPLPRPRPDRFFAPSTAADAIVEITSTPQSVRLVAQVVESGPPIADGLVWRVFEAEPQDSGELLMVARSEDAQAELELPPGEYVVHVAYGRAQLSESLTVGAGGAEKTMVLEAGGLQLNAEITGEIPIPPELLRFDILTAGIPTERTPVAEGLGPNDIVTLNAGTYHVVSRFGAINAVVQTDLRVEAGQLARATLYHRAGQVAFKLVSEPGGEAIADIEWTVRGADGETVFTDLGAFPSTVLAEGEYEVFAKRGDTVFNRTFEVTPSEPREIEVLTSVY